MGFPTGTLTFLFSDIEGSTRLWETETVAMEGALALHDALVRDSIEDVGGLVLKAMGDGFAAVFERAPDAVRCAVTMQRRFRETLWPTTTPITIRIGVHTGAAQFRDGDYFGPALNRTARLMAAAHGGQTLCSRSTTELTLDQLDADVHLVDLGEHRLRDLTRTERVYQLTHPEFIQDFPELRTIDTLPGNLPIPPNRFVGRDALIAELAARLAEERVVTIVGPGGVGKTRLALQAAVAAQPAFADGAWFVDLASVTESEQVGSEVLDTLGYVLADDEDAIGGLCRRLRRRRLLLILDNCEQVVDGAARLADAVAGAAADVRILATSRQGLGVAAEHLAPVPPLDAGARGDAVRLFAARARAVRPDFDLDATLGTVVDLCERLDGIPLAIELAAARTRSLAPAEILERLTARFRILKGNDRTTVDRHQTLQAAVDWSYDLLSDQEQQVFDRLSVFDGGFTLEAAEDVASDDLIDPLEVLDHLDSLVDKSLVVADDTVRGRRFRLLETMRQYAHERLATRGEAERIRHRHAARYTELIEVATPLIDGPGDIGSVASVDADLDNVRAMLSWHLDRGRIEVVADLLSQLVRYIDIRDGTTWALPFFDRCIDAAPSDETLAIVHGCRAWSRATFAHAGVADDLAAAEAAASRAGVPDSLVLNAARATHALVVGNELLAFDVLERLGDDALELGRPYWYAYARSAGLMMLALARPDDVDLLDAVAVCRADIDPCWDSTYVRMNFLLAAAFAHMATEPHKARQYLDERLPLASALRAGSAVADTEFFIGQLQLGAGQFPEAAASCRRALVGHDDLGMRRGVLMTLSGAVGIALRTGRSDEARTVLAGLARARTELDAPGSAIERLAEERMALHAERALDAGVFEIVDAPDLESTIDVTIAMLESIAARSVG